MNNFFWLFAFDVDAVSLSFSLFHTHKHSQSSVVFFLSNQCAFLHFYYNFLYCWYYYYYCCCYCYCCWCSLLVLLLFLLLFLATVTLCAENDVGVRQHFQLISSYIRSFLSYKQHMWRIILNCFVIQNKSGFFFLAFSLSLFLSLFSLWNVCFIRRT